MSETPDCVSDQSKSGAFSDKIYMIKTCDRLPVMSNCCCMILNCVLVMTKGLTKAKSESELSMAPMVLNLLSHRYFNTNFGYKHLVYL